MDTVVESMLGRVEDTADTTVHVVDEAGPAEVTLADAVCSPVVKLANTMLRDAALQGASDIHIQPSAAGGTVRFRVDGMLRQYMRLPLPVLDRVVSRIKVLGALDVADRRRPQDGRATIAVGDRHLDLRMSTVPTQDSEKAVIRLLDPVGSGGLDTVAMPDGETARFKSLLTCREGIVAVTGPTGSGKTTTLYAALRELASEEVNIMTVEDPIEYRLPGVTQIQVEPKRGVTFVSALRAILRQDPDIILVGEIRDRETAEIAVQASLTGYRGRLPVAEIFSMTPELRQLVRSGAPASAVKAAANDAGMRDLRGAALAWAEAGETPLAEVLRVIGDAPAEPSQGAPASEEQATGAPVVEVAGATVAPPGQSAGLPSGSSSAAVNPEESPDAGRVSVLVIDDEPTNRVFARSLLEKAGYLVAEAADGLDAVGRLDGGAYDLMVLDLDMPRLSGYEVLTHARGRLATAGLPIMVFTSTEDESVEADLMEQGADDYIRKPIEPRRFLARVKAVLRRAGG